MLTHSAFNAVFLATNSANFDLKDRTDVLGAGKELFCDFKVLSQWNLGAIPHV